MVSVKKKFVMKQNDEIVIEGSLYFNQTIHHTKYEPELG